MKKSKKSNIQEINDQQTKVETEAKYNWGNEIHLYDNRALFSIDGERYLA